MGTKSSRPAPRPVADEAARTAKYQSQFELWQAMQALNALRSAVERHPEVLTRYPELAIVQTDIPLDQRVEVCQTLERVCARILHHDSPTGSALAMGIVGAALPPPAASPPGTAAAPAVPTME